jgi:proteasome beta subunit
VPVLSSELKTQDRVLNQHSGLITQHLGEKMDMQGDFFQLLKEQGYQFGMSPVGPGGQRVPESDITRGTTILAMKYHDGVLVAGDRRATAGNIVMYDRTDKVLELDRYSVMAIAGVPATAYEMARVLEHSFKYYRRTQLQELSFEGKLRALSKLLKENVPAALAGTGAVAPLFGGYDVDQETAKIYFYDILGAEFEGVEYAVSGSGSPMIRGILHYLNTWGQKPLNAQSEQEAVVQALRLLASAAEFDSATGGINREANLYPVIKLITQNGVTTIPDDRLKSLCDEQVVRYV